MLWRTVFLTRHEKQFQYTLPKSIKWAKICWSIDKQTTVLMAGAGTPQQHRGCPTAPALQRALGEKRRLAECPTHTSGFMGFSFALAFWERLNMRRISLQNLSNESSYSHDLSKQSQSFQPRRSDTISFDHFSYRLLKTRVFLCHRGEGLTSTQYPDRDTTDTHIIIFSIFSHPFFLWPNVLFDLLWLWLHTEQMSSSSCPQRPSGLFPQRLQFI